MAQSFISPGVFTREFDLSFVPTGVSQIGASLIGITKKGPAFQPIKVGSFNEFRQIFGDLDEKYYLPYAVREYLKNAGVVTITRVLGEDTNVSVGTPVFLQFPINGTSAASAAENVVLGVVRARTGTSITSNSLSGTPSNFTLTINGTAVTNLSLDQTSSKYIKNVLGTDSVTAYSGDQLPSVYVDTVYDYYYSTVTGTATAASVTSTSGSSIAVDNQNARTPYVISQNYGGSVYPMFTIYHRSDGNASTNDIKVTITNVEISTTEDLEYPQFTILVRDFYDTDASPKVYESWTVNMDPSSPAYIENMIGNQSPVYDTTGNIPVIMYDGDFENKSKYIYVKVEGGYPITARPSGFQKYPGFALGVMPEVPFKTTHYNTSTSVLDNKVYMGVDITATNSQSIAERFKYSSTLVTGNSNSSNKGFLILAKTDEASLSSSLTSNYTLVDVTSSSAGTVTAGQSYANTVKFTIGLYGGWDGLDPRKDIRNLQNDGTLLDEYTKAINILSNADEYDFNLLMIPGVNSSASGNVIGRAIDMCASRGDAMVIFDLASDSSTYLSGKDITPAQAITQMSKYDSSYGAAFYPWVQIQDPNSSDKRVWVPPSTVVIGAFSYSDLVSQPYYATAGFNRGVLSSVVGVRRKLPVDVRDDLYTNNINPIASFPGEGYVVLGQKTTKVIPSALDRINVRRLLIVMKKIIASTGRLFLFEPNNARTRDKILNLLNPQFTRIKNDNGLEDFRIVLDSTVNTPDIIDRNMLVGQIFLKPTKTAEVIIMDLNITSSGATFEGG